ncbi:DUF2252 domain-containing protein [Microbacterium sp. CFH 31415]|uniref:DUF2252 domain-containing protein n=1 Tax=Microbacterium sp. CFH 31415 TaxID=2921732 RepID=UPI001F133C58|nr:DUF2252 domain-containing protein [Microbacterium sp. CFH 31415]MCH6230389.1 DUF2252 domain-containing protein [Microbacterium sp. CFH 31415]
MSMTDSRPLAETWSPLPTLQDHLTEGRTVRESHPRESLAVLPEGERDPMGILDRQDSTRVPELVPIRTQRMSESAFAFYRGTAALMAADLARSPSSSIEVGSCGDAHVSNFGLFASPQRTLVFDLNDFDESAWAPWEWDVKRLVTSIVIAGQSTSRDDKVVRDAALSAVRTYARALASGAKRSPLKRYYDHFDADAASDSLDPESAEALRKAVKDAEKRTSARAVRKLTSLDDAGRLVFGETPPTMTHVDPRIELRINEFVAQYQRSANVDIRVLLQKYHVTDIARRVVGVGSVGTRCYLISMSDGEGNALILQGKEAGQSVLVEYGGVEQPEAVARYIAENGEGGRVVAMQRILQAVSDPFLGHLTGPSIDGPERSFYVRQFHDKKGGFDVDTLEDAAFGWYADACASTLARAHGQSPNAAVVAGYAGGGRVVGEAILEWSYAYADLSRADWELFRRHRGVGEAG